MRDCFASARNDIGKEEGPRNDMGEERYDINMSLRVLLLKDVAISA